MLSLCYNGWKRVFFCLGVLLTEIENKRWLEVWWLLYFLTFLVLGGVVDHVIHVQVKPTKVMGAG